VAEKVLEAMRADGIQVMVARTDVTQAPQLAAALADIAQRLPPLRGVIHAAAVLDDGILLQLTPERFRTVMAPKIQGAWNLHTLTQDQPLDFFMLFSSMASVIGSPGQANYSAANAFLDALAHHRQRQGRPGLSINWGPWAEVGQAAAQANRGERLALRGIASITPEQGMEALGALLRAAPPQVGVVTLDLRQWREFYPAAADSPLLTHLMQEESSRRRLRPSSSRMRAVLLAAEAGQRRLLLEGHLQEQIAQVLRLAPSQLDARTPLGSLGLDSLMALEVRNRLEVSLGLTLSATLVWSYPTIAALATHLASQLETPLDTPSSSDAAVQTGPDQLAETAAKIAQLSDAEMEALLLKKLENR
jgi:acyl carrier protein